MDTVLIIIGTVNAVLLIIILVKLFFGGKQEIDTGSIVSSVNGVVIYLISLILLPPSQIVASERRAA